MSKVVIIQEDELEFLKQIFESNTPITINGVKLAARALIALENASELGSPPAPVANAPIETVTPAGEILGT